MHLSLIIFDEQVCIVLSRDMFREQWDLASASGQINGEMRRT